MYLNVGFEGLTKLSYLSYASCGQIYLRMMQGAFMHFTRWYATSILLVCIEIASRRVMPTFTYLLVRNIVEQGESFLTTWKPFSVRWQKHPFILPIGARYFGDISNTCIWVEWRFFTWFCLHDKHLHELEVTSLRRVLCCFLQDESSPEDSSTSAVFEFVKDVAEGFMPSYLPIANSRRTLRYGERERQWQLLRRGRYLEFNLLYDRGVKFGLDGGRIESIMVSGNYFCPPVDAVMKGVIKTKVSLLQIFPILHVFKCFISLVISTWFVNSPTLECAHTLRRSFRCPGLDRSQYLTWWRTLSTS